MLNKVFLIGNVGNDPELRQTTAGKSVTNFRIACTEKRRNASSGELESHTEWFNVSVWGKQAEVVAQYLKKGRQVFVEGQLRNRAWEKDGEKRTSVDVTAVNVRFLGSPKKSQNTGEAESPIDTDDIPF